VNKPRTRGRLGSVVGEKWRIEKALGSGGVASVYAAVNLNNGFRVAIKILSDEHSKDEETRKRFLREGYYANKVDHEGIASVMDDGVTEDGALYLIMELLEGSTLHDLRLASPGNKVPFDDAMDIALGVADILAAAHDAGLVHRDVKPQNIFVTKANRIKLLDFGLAGKRQLSDDATRTGAGIGTPQYMAPEQISGEGRIDARVDVFALAATTYRILSGEFPFEAKTLADYLVAALRTTPRPLDALVPEVSPAVASVIARGLASNPDERLADARAFAAALNKALRPERGSYVEETIALATLKMTQEELAKTEVLGARELRARAREHAGALPVPIPSSDPEPAAPLPAAPLPAAPLPAAPLPAAAPSAPGPPPLVIDLGLTPPSLSRRGEPWVSPLSVPAPTAPGRRPAASAEPQRRLIIATVAFLLLAIATFVAAVVWTSR
jgi:serine/threonine-protein kinase